MEREAGSFKEDEKGNLVPNLDDEAMAMRIRMPKKESEEVSDVKNKGARISKS